MRKINRDSLPHLMFCASKALKIRWCSAWTKAAAWWWGVGLGEKCAFNGRPRFNRHPESHISIGSGCIFNSLISSNFIGVNRPCMISTLKEGARIEIGDRCGFSGTVIACGAYIALGNHIRCGANTLITDTDWHTEDHRAGADAPVIIEDNVWLGVNVTVLKGVTIGHGALVGANSLVNRSLPPGVIAAGNPARIIRKLNH